jgi:Glycosyl transferases group 1
MVTNMPARATSADSTSGVDPMSRAAAFFDGIGTAHSLPLVEGLDDAAFRIGLSRQWTTALRPPGAANGSCSWTPTRSFYADFCETGSFSPLQYRRAAQDAITRAEASNAAFFCDLAVEQLLASYGRPVRVELPGVWVVHQVPHPRRTGPATRRTKVLAANPRRWTREARLAHARSLLRGLARSGGRFVVHNVGARERLARIVPPDVVHLGSWPIVAASAPPQLASGNGNEVVAVFPGECREGKGLDVLLGALPAIRGVDRFDLPTVVNATAQALVQRSGDPRLEIGTSWLTNDEYHGHLRAATLAVLPYRTAAMANAGISASLLDVLSVGLPAVITRPIARALPDDYEGAVVVEPDSVDALAAGVVDAVQRIDELRAAAQRQGPAFVVANHSYEKYLETIVEVGTSS